MKVGCEIVKRAAVFDDSEEVRNIVGYHGTLKEHAEKIYDSKTYIEGSDRADHWLGPGIYFFEDDVKQAEIWANTKSRKIGKAAVLRTEIELKKKYLLDLNTRSGVEVLEKRLQELNDAEFEIEISDDQDIKEFVHFLFSTFSSEEVWVIRKAFPVKARMNDNVKKLNFKENDKKIEYGLSSPQICVKNSEAILKDSIQYKGL